MGMNAPSWQELRDLGYVVTDLPHRRLAIYPTIYGTVVMAAQQGDQPTVLTGMLASEMTAFKEAVLRAHQQANTVVQEIESAKSAAAALKRARGMECPTSKV